MGCISCFSTINSNKSYSYNCFITLFYEKAATLSMIKRGMDVQRLITTYLNPGQIPVTAFDQPLLL